MGCVFPVKVWYNKTSPRAGNTGDMSRHYIGVTTVDNCTTIPEKRCSKCGKYYPKTVEFFKLSRKQKWDSWCRKCNSAAQRERDARLKQDAEYRKKESKRVESCRKRRAENDPEYRERQSIRNKEYYLKNRDSILKSIKTKRLTDPDYRQKAIDRAAVNHHRRRALKMGSGGKYTKADVELHYQSQKGRCWWCGKSLNGNFHIDHRVPLSRGGSNDARNICISCPECNCRKHDKYPHEWNGRLL